METEEHDFLRSKDLSATHLYVALKSKLKEHLMKEGNLLIGSSITSLEMC